MAVTPPNGISAHEDSFARDQLPDQTLWPEFDFSATAELARIPDHLNAAAKLLDHNIALGNGARPVLHLEDVTWSYNDLLSRANQVARVLTEDCGLRTGGRVLLRAPNTPMLVATWLAVLKAGGICVTTMPLLRAGELKYIIEKAAVSHALCDVAFGDALEEAQKQTDGLEHLLYFSATGATLEGTTLQSLADAKPKTFTNVDTAADDVALIAFTSGTTGNPKGTMHFHRDLIAAADCLPHSIARVVPSDIISGTPPLAFTFGLGGLTLFPMRYGASTRFVTENTPEALLSAVQDYGVTQLYTAPTAYRAMAGLAGDYNLSSLRQGVSAGETLPKATWEAFYDATGIRLIDGLGATELLHVFVAAAPTDMRAGFTGTAIPGYQARVVDEDSNELPRGTPGLLAVKGPTGCRYLDDADRQKAYVRDGWNYPGDVYEQDEDGYFRYVSRADDMIISSGYNIAGPEVEAALLEHTDVAECAVIGVPDEVRTNIVKAFVVLRDGGVEDADALQDFVKARIAPYKYPRAVEFVVELPKTQTGKLQRFKLRS
ncbi:MAG: AMP-binding protein [Pseudomonadota bacterium]|nr:AMP-binding protein [Pseudomonadota bacterium]